MCFFIHIKDESDATKLGSVEVATEEKEEDLTSL